MSTSLTLRPEDPAELGSYPATLPIEIALRVSTVPQICAAYGIDQVEWARISRDPLFVADLKRCLEELKKDGMSFKMKARLQADELLKTSWNLIHASSDEVPPSVKADLIKSTFRVAGLDNKDVSAQTMNPVQININLG